MKVRWHTLYYNPKSPLDHTRNITDNEEDTVGTAGLYIYSVNEI